MGIVHSVATLEKVCFTSRNSHRFYPASQNGTRLKTYEFISIALQNTKVILKMDHLFLALFSHFLLSGHKWPLGIGNHGYHGVEHWIKGED